MDDEAVIAIMILAFVLVFIGVLIGVGVGSPDELDNGCIIYGNSVYCKETSE